MNTLIDATAGESTRTHVFIDHSKMPARILVVEDDGDIRRLVTEALVRAGFDVDAAENGSRGWKALHLKPYDLVITDHDMPEMTGMQMVRKLRLAGMHMPVVLMSGSALPPEALSQNAWLRFAAMLEKPFGLEELIDTVRGILPEGEATLAVAAAAQQESFYEGNPETRNLSRY